MTNKDFEIEVLESIVKLNDSLWYILKNIVIFDKEILKEIFKLLDKTQEIINNIKEEVR